MSKYEINYPDAEGMVAIEREQQGASKLENIRGLSPTREVDLIHYRDGTVADCVYFEIRRQEWLKSHQPNVDKVLAVVCDISNSKSFQDGLLKECLRQLGSFGYPLTEGWKDWDGSLLPIPGMRSEDGD